MGHKLLPDKYYPYTTLESVLEYMNRGLLDEDDFTLLKVLGDAVCANEDQLRRYMRQIFEPFASIQETQPTEEKRLRGEVEGANPRG